MHKFNLQRMTIEMELPRSLGDCHRRQDQLKHDLKVLEDSRPSYRSQKEHWSFNGKAIQNINAELQILNNWEKQMQALLKKEFGKNIPVSGAGLLDFTSPDDIIQGLYTIIERRLSHERPLRFDEKPAMTGAMRWLREWKSIVIAPSIEPKSLGEKIKPKSPKLKIAKRSR